MKILALLRDEKVSRGLYFIGIAAIVTGLFYSRALLSIGQMVVAGTFLVSGNLKEKFTRFFQNKLAVLLASLYFLHLLGLWNTSDYSYALKDLRVKLPVLLFPVVFSTVDLFKGQQFKYLIYFFISVLISSTLVSTGYYYLSEGELMDMRRISLFISHIRFSLLSCLAIVFCIYYAMSETRIIRLILLAAGLWILFFLLLTESITGLTILLILSPLLIWKLWKKGSMTGRTSWIVSAVIAASVIAVSGIFTWAAVEHFQIEEKKIADLTQSESGCDYEQLYQREHYKVKENGYYVFQNICRDELRTAWNKRSDFTIGNTGEQQARELILIRYLASKGLPKNAASVEDLSAEEVAAIAHGVTNVEYLGKPGIYVRVRQIFWEVQNYFGGGNFNGHSLAMRLEFWRTGLNIICDHPLTGVGTGDIDAAFHEQYVKDESDLRPEWRFRSHNQWITVAATFGIPGLALFALIVFWPVFHSRRNLLYLCFALIFICSIVAEDTIDTQIGVSFYAFFNSLLLFQLRPSVEANKA